MGCDGRDNIKKIWRFISMVVPWKKQKRNKTKLNRYSDFEESLFWSDCKSIRSNNDNKNDYSNSNNYNDNNNNK